MNETPKIFQVAETIADLIIINLLFLVCSLPIFTFGASLSALYYTTLKMVRDEETAPISKDFFKAFKTNFKQATILWLIFLAFGGSLFLDLRFAWKLEKSVVKLALLGILLFIAILYFLTFTLLFPLVARFQNTAKNHVKNAFILSLTKLRYSLPAAVLHLCVWIIFAVPSKVGAWILFSWIFIWFSLTAYMNSTFLRGLFDKISGE